jgi:hypothetical protein
MQVLCAGSRTCLDSLKELRDRCPRGFCLRPGWPREEMCVLAAREIGDMNITIETESPGNMRLLPARQRSIENWQLA